MNKDYKSINNLWKDSEGYRYFGTLKLSSKIKYDGDDFIPLWEWINQLQQENKKLNGAIQTYDILLKSNIEENKQLKAQIEEYQKVLDETMSEKIDIQNNWNKLKEYIKQEPTLDFYNDKLPFEVIMVKIINKMQEIEQGSDSNDSN